jgi:hypothetical protein
MQNPDKTSGKNFGFFTSRVVRGIVVGALALAVLLLVFWGGMSFGYQRALFASRFGENYERNFIGTDTRVPGAHPDDIMNSHGASGEILSINGSIISVKGQNGVEQAISVGTTTIIEKSKNTITINDLSIGDYIVAIGSPNASGQIEAHLIRVIPAPAPDQSPASDPGSTSQPSAGQAQ